MHGAGQGMRLRPWLKLSSLGVGTYLGSETDEEDEKVTCGVIETVGNGINVIDTARNYRCDTYIIVRGDTDQDRQS